MILRDRGNAESQIIQQLIEIGGRNRLVRAALCDPAIAGPSHRQIVVTTNVVDYFPDEIAGKTAVGVEDEWIVGGELSCCGSGWTYRATEITRAIDWVRGNRWMPTNSIVAELFQAPYARA
jgi:hypothetical protein